MYIIEFIYYYLVVLACQSENKFSNCIFSLTSIALFLIKDLNKQFTYLKKGPMERSSFYLFLFLDILNLGYSYRQYSILYCLFKQKEKKCMYK
jgi:hypothetical protein